MLTDLSGVDNYGEDPRYEVDYLLYSLTHRLHFRPGPCHFRSVRCAGCFSDGSPFLYFEAAFLSP